MTNKLGPYELNQIYTGDARELAKAIPDESVDLILCDPLYNHPDDYRWLAMIAYRILKPYRSVIAQSGHIYRFECEIAMQHNGLVKRPLLSEVFTGGFRTIWMHNVNRANHPYIWLEKTGIDPRRHRVPTMFFGRKDKSIHKYGDGESSFVRFLNWFTENEDIVFDPFTGGGTVPAVCKQLGRNYLAFEIDPETAERARERVRNTQPPLFVPEPVQQSFFGGES